MGYKRDMSTSGLGAWLKEFEPAWAAGIWLGQEIWDRGLDRLTALGISPDHLWEISLSLGQLQLRPYGSDNKTEIIGMVVSHLSSDESNSEFEELEAGYYANCSGCLGKKVDVSGISCKSCFGSGYAITLDPKIAALPTSISALVKEFTGESRYKIEIAKFRAWESHYKPIFWAFDDEIDEALELLDELGVSEEHLWTHVFEYRDQSVVGVLDIYEEDAESEGSVGLYITEVPVDDFYEEAILSEDAYACLECSGYGAGCLICGDAGWTRIEFGPSKLISSDLNVLRKFFG